MRESRSPALIPSATELSTPSGVFFLNIHRSLVIVAFKFDTKNKVRIAEKMLQNACYTICHTDQL